MSFSVYIVATSDAAPVERRFMAVTAANLREVGAQTRREMRGLLKYGRGTSRPGQPPVVHAGRSGRSRTRRPFRRAAQHATSPLRDGILFGQPDPLSVITGATRVGSGETSVARALEEGGLTTRWDGKRIHVEARPFMKVAHGRVVRTAPALWTDSL